LVDEEVEAVRCSWLGEAAACVLVPRSTAVTVQVTARWTDDTLSYVTDHHWQDHTHSRAGHCCLLCLLFVAVWISW